MKTWERHHVKRPHLFHGLKRGGYGAILVDPPTGFETYSGATEVTARGGKNKPATTHYVTMTREDIAALPVGDLAAVDCVLFLWSCWPTSLQSYELIERWGFEVQDLRFLLDEGRPGRRGHGAADGHGLLDAREYRSLLCWQRAGGRSACMLTCPRRSSNRGASTPASPIASMPGSSGGRRPYVELFARQRAGLGFLGRSSWQVQCGERGMSNLPLLLNGKIIDEVSADDRAWFKNNPDCLFRLRKMVKVEFNNWPIGYPGTALHGVCWSPTWRKVCEPEHLSAFQKPWRCQPKT